MLKRQIIPSARAELTWIEQTYGFSKEVDEWCRQIVSEARHSTRPITGLTEVPIEQVFEELEAIEATNDSDWARSLQKFQAGGWLDRIKALKVILTQRTPPWQLRLNSRVFRGLDGVISVEIEVLYDIDHTSKTVTFLRFESFNPGHEYESASYEATSW